MPFLPDDMGGTHHRTPVVVGTPRGFRQVEDVKPGFGLSSLFSLPAVSKVVTYGSSVLFFDVIEMPAPAVMVVVAGFVEVGVVALLLVDIGERFAAGGGQVNGVAELSVWNDYSYDVTALVGGCRPRDDIRQDRWLDYRNDHAVAARRGSRIRTCVATRECWVRRII